MKNQVTGDCLGLSLASGASLMTKTHWHPTVEQGHMSLNLCVSQSWGTENRCHKGDLQGIEHPTIL